jgi:hypothetical protein
VSVTHRCQGPVCDLYPYLHLYLHLNLYYLCHLYYLDLYLCLGLPRLLVRRGGE